MTASSLTLPFFRPPPTAPAPPARLALPCLALSLMPQNWMCYPAYCLCASCPCCVGDTRELVAEKYNLPISEWEPDDCGWCLVKFIGMRLMCVASVCLLPCFHVAQMRAEVAFRRHGKPTVCPCCCCWCGDGEGPGASSAKDEELDYPRDKDVKRVVTKEVLDYPRAGARVYEEPPSKQEEVEVVAEYPHASARRYALDEYAPPVPADYPR